MRSHYLSRFFAVIMALLAFTLVMPKPAQAGVYIVDTAIPPMGTDMASIRTYTSVLTGQTVNGAGTHGLAQVFKVQHKYLVGAMVYVRSGGSGETLTMKVDDFDTHQTLRTVNKAITTISGWVEYNFDAIEVNPNKMYGVYLSTTSNNMKWVYIDGTNPCAPAYCYSMTNGSAAQINDDYSLITYSLDSLDGGAAPGGNNPTPTAASGASSGKKADSSSKTKTVDTSIASPTLEYVIADGTKTSAPIPAKYSVKQDDAMTVVGKSFANAKIILLIGEKSYNTLADKDGKWEITIPTTELTISENTVKAQAQDLTKNKGSAIVDLFKVTITSTAKKRTGITPVTVSEDIWSALTSDNSWYYYGAGAIILCMVVGLLYHRYHRKHY